MAGQVPPPERERRAALLREIGRDKAEAFRRRHVGRTVRALVEGRPGRAHGLTGNYLKVAVRAGAAEIGAFRDIGIVRHEGGTLHGELRD
jgi:tRNA A37 methylthiotransferase MiaB